MPALDTYLNGNTRWLCALCRDRMKAKAKSAPAAELLCAPCRARYDKVAAAWPTRTEQRLATGIGARPKRCTVCKRTKEPRAFPRLGSICKQCASRRRRPGFIHIVSGGAFEGGRRR